MSGGKSVTISLRILDKDYVVACPEEERETLIAAAQYLNQKVQEVRVGGKLVSNERIVVVSALNIIHEYFQDKQQKDDYINSLNAEIRQLQEKIEVALSKIKQCFITSAKPDLNSAKGNVCKKSGSIKTEFGTLKTPI